MKKLDNFSNCLNVLKNADFSMADNDEIYRTGVIAKTCSPREILQLGYKLGFVNDSAVWLAMLKKRNTPVYIYDEDETDEMLLLIRDSFIPAFLVLEETLKNKLREAGDDWG